MEIFLGGNLFLKSVMRNLLKYILPLFLMTQLARQCFSQLSYDLDLSPLVTIKFIFMVFLYFSSQYTRAMEVISSWAVTGPPDFFWFRSDGTENYHRPNMQRLHFEFRVWCFHKVCNIILCHYAWVASFITFCLSQTVSTLGNSPP